MKSSLDIEPLAVVPLDGVREPVLPTDRVLVGVATEPLTDAGRKIAATLDLTVVPPDAVSGQEFVHAEDPLSEVDALRDAAGENPHATSILAQVLRVTSTVDVPLALDVESFAYSTLLGGPEFAHWLVRRGPRSLPPRAPREPVRMRRDGDRLLLTLDWPERRNAYGREMRDTLVEALRLPLLDDTITRVVLDGEGPCFCAGGDLGEFGTAPDPVTAHFVRTRAGAGCLLHELAERVEVRVHGSCVGAGIELPAFAGRVVAHPDATFRLPEVAMGLIPGAGGTVSISRRIGRWRTFFLALSGRELTAATALEWGLVDVLED